MIGGGPAGLMAAEVLAAAGVAVTVYDQMPSVGRKLLMAGRGGLNLTHAEPLPVFLSRYGARACLAGADHRRVSAGGADRVVQRPGPADLRRVQRAGVSRRR